MYFGLFLILLSSKEIVRPRLTFTPWVEPLSNYKTLTFSSHGDGW